MATLHVRNFPDDLYELLRDRAAANDRSIGAETIQLLQERLAGVPGRAPFPFPLLGRRRQGASGLFTRFTPRARQAIVAAQAQARELGHADIDTGHLLLGVLLQEDAPVVQCLRALGVTFESTRAAVERRPRDDAEQAGQIPFQPGAKQALEIALRESLKLGVRGIGCEHVALGIAGEGEGPGGAVLRAAEPNEETLRRKLMPVGTMSFETHGAPAEAFRVISLEGGAADWERLLNEAAALGYDLLEVVDRRAVMRRA
jgi:ATP-dependent Clp protease ATP-binding subunit ClpC